MGLYSFISWRASPLAAPTLDVGEGGVWAVEVGLFSDLLEGVGQVCMMASECVLMVGDGVVEMPAFSR